MLGESLFDLESLIPLDEVVVEGRDKREVPGFHLFHAVVLAFVESAVELSVELSDETVCVVVWSKLHGLGSFYLYVYQEFSVEELEDFVEQRHLDILFALYVSNLQALGEVLAVSEMLQDLGVGQIIDIDNLLVWSKGDPGWHLTVLATVEDHQLIVLGYPHL